MRPAPPSPPPSLARKAPLPFIERSYRFLTWVFGGGVTVRDHEKDADAVTPIRGASVRGQLRFWWRACNPRGCRTLDELRKREGEIWGTTSQASQVDLTVVEQPAKRNTVEVFKYSDKGRLVVCRGLEAVAYGAFPLQPSSELQKRKARPGVLYDYGNSVFSLRLRFPEELRADVEAALWAWETFGGLGGRTRRGFGAISRGDSPGAESVEVELVKYRENPSIEKVPSLHQARFKLARGTHPSAFDAWTEGLGLLQRLRQGADFGRNPPQPHSKKPAGRSRWPEPDEIRKLTGKSAPLHKEPVVRVSRFPRAAFGLPIIFHFHPGSADEPGSSGDPKMKPLQLQPVGFERFASPLILRPVPDGKAFRTAALVLSSSVPDCVLRVEDTDHRAQWSLTEADARQIPALRRNGNVFTDPLQLFLEELER